MRVEARKVDGDLLYFTCTMCSEDIYHGFSRFSGPIKHFHYHQAKHQHPCRLIVIPDPVGDAHEIVQVPDEDSMDAYLQDALDDLHVAIRLAQAWAYRAGELAGRSAA